MHCQCAQNAFDLTHAWHGRTYCNCRRASSATAPGRLFGGACARKLTELGKEIFFFKMTKCKADEVSDPGWSAPANQAQRGGGKWPNPPELNSAPALQSEKMECPDSAAAGLDISTSFPISFSLPVSCQAFFFVEMACVVSAIALRSLIRARLLLLSKVAACPLACP